ncbi:hypothetical protein [Pseudomonas sp. NPDC087817]|uniref:hypothetical protein n=1 Tax=Pseudomonas sp. NPDC087817 TaxID=3364451 RepID=UPI0038206D51
MTITIFVLIAVGVGVMLWLNPDAPSNTNQIVTLLGALALACIAVSPFVKPEEKYSFYTITLFRDTETGSFMVGPMFHPYWNAIGPLLVGLPSTISAFGPAMQVDDEKVPELLQIILAKQLLQNLKGSWDGQVVNLPGVFGGTQPGKLIIASPSPSETLSHEKIKMALANNSFVNLLDESSIQMPLGASLTSGPPADRYIELKANGFKIMVAVVGMRGGTLNQSIWGVIDPPADSPTRYEVRQYTVVAKAETSVFRRYPKGIESYWRWYENVKETLAEIDWKTIDAAMVDQSRRAEYPDLLEQMNQRHRSHNEL